MPQAFPPSLLILSPRVTRVSDPATSVAGLNTTQLADGCLVYCQQNKAEYQLDRTSTAVPDGTTVIQPSAGPGRWLLFSGGSSSNSTPVIYWRPDGTGTAVTWADVMTLIGTTPGVIIWVDQSPAVYEIPAGTYDVLHATFVAPETATPIGIVFDDGAEVQNLAGIDNVSLGFATTAAAQLSWSGSLAIFRMRGFFSSLQAFGSAAPIQISTGQVLYVFCTGQAQIANAGAAAIDVQASAVYVVVEDVMSDTLDDNSVTGNGTALLGVIQDGSFQDTAPTFAGFAGTFGNAAIGTVGGAGPTAFRPSPAIGPLADGATYFDTDETRSIIWDGTFWNVQGKTYAAVNGGAPTVVGTDTVLASMSVTVEEGGWAVVAGKANLTVGTPGDVTLSLRLDGTTLYSSTTQTVAAGVATLPLATSIQVGGGIGAGTFLFELIATVSGGAAATVPARAGQVSGAEFSVTLTP